MKNSNKLHFFDFLKVVFLFSIPLFLIGHSASTDNPFQDTCDLEREYLQQNTYFIARSTRFDSSDASYLKLTGNGRHEFLHDARPSDKSYGNIRLVGLENNETFSVSIESNETESEFSSMVLIQGLCNGDENAIKLSAPIIAGNLGRFFTVDYLVREEDLGMATSVSGPSMSSYILSGGNTGAENISVPGSVDVFVNSVLVYDGNDGDINPPISFSAATGDQIEVVINSLSVSGSTSQLWLHSPSGRGELLSYHLELSDNDEFRAIYEIKF